jgi:acyl carrier protein
MQDGALFNQTASNLRQTLAPKVDAVTKLLETSPKVSSTVLFSSIAGQLGSSGQSSYAVANSALDSMSESYRHQGRPSVSVAWGAWAGAGMATQSKTIAARLNKVGIALITPQHGLSVLSQLIEGLENGGSNVLAAGLNWSTLLTAGRERKLFYSQFVVEKMKKETTGNNAYLISPSTKKVLKYESQLTSAKVTINKELVARIVSRVAGRDVRDEEPLLSAGIDSIGAVELQRELQQLVGVDLSPTIVFDYPTIIELSGYLKSVEAQRSDNDDDNGGAALETSPSPPHRKKPSSSQRVTYMDVLTKVMNAATEVTDKTSIQPDTPFLAAGIDSLGAVDLQRQLAAMFDQVEIPTTAVFDYPSAHQLAEYIMSNMKDDVVSEEEEEALVDQHVLALPLSPVNKQEMQTIIMSKGAHIINPKAPRLLSNEKAIFTVPNIRNLQRMRDDQLAAVPRFVIGKKGMGEIAFLYPVNLLNVDLHSAVKFERGRISISSSCDGLDRPALLTFRQIYPKQKLQGLALEGFTSRLGKMSVKMGGVFVHYDAETGIWVMKTDVWRR